MQSPLALFFLQFFGRFDDIFNGDSVFLKQAVIRGRFAETVLNSNAFDLALAHFGNDLADSRAKPVKNVMIFDGNDFSDVFDAIFDCIHVQRLNRVHIDDFC